MLLRGLIDLRGCPGGGGGTPYNGLYGEAPPERGTFLQAGGMKKGRDFTSLSIEF